MNPVRPAFELRMGLHGNKESTVRILHRLDQFSIRARTAEDNSAFLYPLSESWGDLIAVTMPFADHIRAINLMKHGAILNQAWI